MRVRVRAPKGLRVPLPGKQYVTDDEVELERTPFVDELIRTGNLVDVDAEAEAEAARKRPAPAKAEPTQVKES